MQKKTLRNAVINSKVPYELVEVQVEKMYADGLGKNETLDSFLTKVESFIESCGWDLDDFEKRAMFGELN